MAYIVLETHGGPEYAIVCMNEDGTTAVFDTKKEAESFSEEDPQRGIVVDFRTLKFDMSVLSIEPSEFHHQVQ